MVQRILQSTFVKFTSVVFVGNVVSQLIIFIAFALFARHFPKEDIGIYTIFISLSIVLAIIATGRYELAIMLPKKDNEAFSLFKASVVLAAVFSIVLFAVVELLPLHLLFSNFTTFTTLKPYLYLLPLGVFFMASFQSCLLFNNRLEKYTQNAVLKILQAVLMLSLSFFLAKYCYSVATALVLAWVISQAIVLVVNLAMYVPFYKNGYSLAQTQELLKKYKRYPTIALTGNFVETLANELPNYIIPTFYGVATQTLYAYGNKVAAAPRNFIASAVGDVFFKTSSVIAHDNPNKLLQHTKKITLTLFVFSISIYGIAILLSKFIFPLFFGADYTQAAYYFNWIAFASIFMFVKQPISTIDDVVQRLKPTFVFNIVALVIKSITLYFAASKLNNPIHAIAIYAVLNAILALFWIFYLHKMANDFKSVPS
ncbi:MAG: oligosaccharide flippase family protein [Chitinophagales bacterium]|nr:oligosaccharide flippase family protein [Chitinophagales bacterium]